MNKIYHSFSILRESSLRMAFVSSLCVCLLVGCSPSAKTPAEKAEAAVPESAKQLVSPTPEQADSVLPHTVDTATEFPQAMVTLGSSAVKPSVRAAAQNEIKYTEGDASSEPASTLQKHTVAPKGAQQLDKDWSGVVLVPDPKKMSRAYTSDVSLERIEAHPLENGHLRVWVRVRNETEKVLKTEIACNFKDSNKVGSRTDFAEVEIPPAQSVDSFFISPQTDIAYYTILVR